MVRTYASLNLPSTTVKSRFESMFAVPSAGFRAQLLNMVILASQLDADRVGGDGRPIAGARWQGRGAGSAVPDHPIAAPILQNHDSGMRGQSALSEES